VFGGAVVAFAVSITHWIDIGGAVGGSISTDAADTYPQGLQLPGVPLYDGGTRNEAIIDLIAANIRLPRTGLGDLNAGLTAVAIGERRGRGGCGPPRGRPARP